MDAAPSNRFLKGVLVAMFIVGWMLVGWGFLMHRLSVYAMEVPMLRDLEVPSTRSREFHFHLDQLKDLGDVPGYFGWLIIVLVILAMWKVRRAERSPETASMTGSIRRS